MTNFGQKLPLGRSIHQIAQQKALDHIHEIGAPLPASIVKIKGSIVTVKFEVDSKYNLVNVMMPIAENFYSRGAHKVGDKGYVLPSIAGIGHISGLGPSAAPGLAKPGNLSALAFQPLGNVQWQDTGGVRLNHGEKGAVNQTTDGKNQAGGIPDGVLLTAKGFSIVLTKPALARLAIAVGASILSGENGWSATGSADQSTPGGGTPAQQITIGNTTLNQLLLAYQYVQPASGDTVVVASNIVVTIIDPASSLPALTVDMPSAPVDQQVQFVSFTNGVTSLVMGGGTIANAPTTIPSGGMQLTLQYVGVMGVWYPI